jgi:hypothetical protein
MDAGKNPIFCTNDPRRDPPLLLLWQKARLFFPDAIG